MDSHKYLFFGQFLNGYVAQEPNLNTLFYSTQYSIVQLLVRLHVTFKVTFKAKRWKILRHILISRQVSVMCQKWQSCIITPFFAEEDFWFELFDGPYLCDIPISKVFEMWSHIGNNYVWVFPQFVPPSVSLYLHDGCQVYDCAYCKKIWTEHSREDSRG